MPSRKVVYKHVFGDSGSVTVTLPRAMWKPVHVGVQSEVTGSHDGVLMGFQYCLWTEQWLASEGDVLVEDEVTFRIYGTGHMIPHDHEHVGTFQDGSLVWHVYQTTPTPLPLAAEWVAVND